MQPIFSFSQSADLRAIRDRLRTSFGLEPDGYRAQPIDQFILGFISSQGLDADDLYELHWHLKRLGQSICKHFQAEYSSCPLSDICMKRLEGDAAARSHAA